jgi:hypothetical protein
MNDIEPADFPEVLKSLAARDGRGRVFILLHRYRGSVTLPNPRIHTHSSGLDQISQNLVTLAALHDLQQAYPSNPWYPKRAP